VPTGLHGFVCFISGQDAVQTFRLPCSAAAKEASLNRRHARHGRTPENRPRSWVSECYHSAYITTTTIIRHDIMECHTSFVTATRISYIVNHGHAWPKNIAHIHACLPLEQPYAPKNNPACNGAAPTGSDKARVEPRTTTYVCTGPHRVTCGTPYPAGETTFAAGTWQEAGRRRREIRQEGRELSSRAACASRVPNIRGESGGVFACRRRIDG